MVRPLLLGAVGIIAASLSAATPAAQSAPQTQRQVQTIRIQNGSLLPSSAGRNPYAVVFVRPVAQLELHRRAPGVLPGEPRVDCGTRVFDADPAFDARIRKPTPNQDAQPAIRKVPAPACR